METKEKLLVVVVAIVEVVMIIRTKGKNESK